MKNGNLISKWKDTSDEKPVFLLLYRYESDEMSHIVDLNSECKNDDLFEYIIEYTIANVKSGRYICSMQSKCYFSLSKMSDRISVWNGEDVSFNSIYFFLILIKHFNVYNHKEIFSVITEMY